MASDNRALAIAFLEHLQRTSATREIRSARKTQFQKEYLRQFALEMGFGEEFVAAFEQEKRRAQRRSFSRYEDPIWVMAVTPIVRAIEEALAASGDPPGKKILFGTAVTGDVNGEAINFDNPEYCIVLIDDGVFGFANLLAKSLAHMMPLRDGGDGLDLDIDPAVIEAKLNAGTTLFPRFAELFANYAVNGDPHLAPEYNPTVEYIPLTSAWRDAMEFFIFGHEFGHVRLGHLDDANRHLIPRNGYTGIGVNWDHEFAADRFGLRVTLACLREHQKPALTYAGIEMFLRGLETVDRTVAELFGREYKDEGSDTHPPLGLRIDSLRVALRNHLNEAEYQDAVLYASRVDGLFRTMWPPLKEEIEALLKGGAKPHDKWH